MSVSVETLTASRVQVKSTTRAAFSRVPSARERPMAQDAKLSKVPFKTVYQVPVAGLLQLQAHQISSATA